MEEVFSDRLRRDSWAAPVAELVGFLPVSFGSPCPVLPGGGAAARRGGRAEGNRKDPAQLGARGRP